MTGFEVVDVRMRLDRGGAGDQLGDHLPQVRKLPAIQQAGHDDEAVAAIRGELRRRQGGSRDIVGHHPASFAALQHAC